MSRWIKCSERMPELGDDGNSEMVLVVGKKKIIQQNFLVDDEWVFPMDITHWMPLPKLPNDETSICIAEQLKALQSNPDKEAAHSQADKILCDLLNSLGYDDVVKEFENLEKWYA